MPENTSPAKLSHMASNLVELIELLQKLDEQNLKPDPNLKKGQVYASDFTIVTL